jgi:2-succinyl-5-enolpyruvyl-6-hydroxy-3-cyclohexene-1-carboxylate synthase
MLRGLPVTVVVLNNDGGGIFSFLPVSEHKPFFEPFFGTPQGVGSPPRPAMFGLRYESPRRRRNSSPPTGVPDRETARP